MLALRLEECISFMTNSSSELNFSQMSLIGFQKPEQAGTEPKLPPMLSQYVEYKNRYSECIIFFQVGDFYEVFFEDAIRVANALNITLTSRDKSSEQPIPMCGVPIASLEAYLDRLIDQGFSAAVVSQVNSSSISRLPSAYKEEHAGAKLNITRQLSRIVTPGIRLLSDSQANADTSSYVAALYFGQAQHIAIAYTEAQTGKVITRSVLSELELIEELSRISPIEIVLPQQIDGQKLDGRSSLVKKLLIRIPRLIIKFRDYKAVALRESQTNNEFKSLDPDLRQAAQRLIAYVDETTIGARIDFNSFVSEKEEEIMQISSVTRANLELLSSPTAGPQAGLLFDLNLTKSSAGSRLFRSWLLKPLTNKKQIEARYDLVAFFLEAQRLSSTLRKILETCPDLERIASRVELNCVSPKELAVTRDLLASLETSSSFQEIAECSPQLTALEPIAKKLKSNSELVTILQQRLEDQPPAQLGDGYTIKSGFNSELDQYRLHQNDGRSWVQQFEKSEQIRTGLSNLKVKFNYVLGFFIEVTKSQVSKVPSDYEKRQSTTSADRFVTPELKAQEKLVLGADEKSLSLERKLYQELKYDLIPFCSYLRSVGQALSQLDVFLSLAELARRREYIRPTVTDGTEFILEDGRHPVVETALGSSFVPNSLNLDKSLKPALILTGPNMGGKSTFLRQAGILAIMAQMGSFVPAKKFQLGIVDQIFARIGASDNIAGGESTFMVEMREVVQIVAASTEKSLILIDEVGRGTSTIDGEALAQAIIEWLQSSKNCRVLFATHFHKLTKLATDESKFANICVAAIEDHGEIVFTHKIAAGAAGQSYGLEVAKLAGLPNLILQRARELVEAGPLQSPKSKPEESTTIAKSEPIMDSKSVKYQSIKNEINSLDLNGTTPMQALNFLVELKSKFKDESN
jgi:DNA mismatch repair protein MutS